MENEIKLMLSLGVVLITTALTLQVIMSGLNIGKRVGVSQTDRMETATNYQEELKTESLLWSTIDGVELCNLISTNLDTDIYDNIDIYVAKIDADDPSVLDIKCAYTQEIYKLLTSNLSKELLVNDAYVTGVDATFQYKYIAYNKLYNIKVDSTTNKVDTSSGIFGQFANTELKATSPCYYVIPITYDRLRKTRMIACYETSMLSTSILESIRDEIAKDTVTRISKNDYSFETTDEVIMSILTSAMNVETNPSKYLTKYQKIDANYTESEDLFYDGSVLDALVVVDFSGTNVETNIYNKYSSGSKSLTSSYEDGNSFDYITRGLDSEVLSWLISPNSVSNDINKK